MTSVGEQLVSRVRAIFTTTVLDGVFLVCDLGDQLTQPTAQPRLRPEGHAGHGSQTEIDPDQGQMEQMHATW
ncbi:MAG: hypothetical protein ACI9EF_003264 [Pseudohongiellaceae bacterium]